MDGWTGGFTEGKGQRGKKQGWKVNGVRKWRQPRSTQHRIFPNTNTPFEFNQCVEYPLPKTKKN